VSTDNRTAPFAPTRWTLVLRARGDSAEARVALNELCEGYYQPVFRFLRREGRDEDSARELTQEFFARMLARGELGGVDPVRGRFRTYLLGAVKHFLADARDREHAAKRGGGHKVESLDTGTDTTDELSITANVSPPSDTFFDREWALALMDRALAALAGEFEAEGKQDQYNALKPWLVGDTEALSQAEAAGRLGLSEGAVKVAIHRLRKRFRDLIKAEVTQTLDDPAQAEAELRYLVEVLSSP
jgi:RNA polymerase sigma-70 factor (ECF subfamily)